MKQEKHHKRSRRRSGKFAALLVSLFLILSAAVGGTIAFLTESTGPLHNLFNPSQVTTEIAETLDGAVKKDVYIKNTGDTDAWIRAAVTVTWQDKDGNVYGKAPVEATDYEINWGTDWKKGSDGFYYWTSPVAAKTGVTGDLIESCTSKTVMADYFLTVEIIGSGIQSKPANAFDTAWSGSGLKVDDTDADPVKWKLVSREVQE